MYIIFDTETTGLPGNFNAPVNDTSNWPRVVQIAWQLHDDLGTLIEHKDFLIKPNGFNIPFDAEKVHGISTLLAETNGVDLDFAINEFKLALDKSKFVVGHNVGFDLKVVGCELVRLNDDLDLFKFPVLDTCTELSANLCQLPGGRGGRFKLPTLSELHQHLFNVPFGEAHNATADVEATTRCFFELIRIGNYPLDILQQENDYLNRFQQENFEPIKAVGISHVNLKNESEKLAKEQISEEVHETIASSENYERLKNVKFAHLHNHTQFSVLQSTIKINDLIKTTAKLGMPAVAMTDYANMMGAFLFEKEVSKHNKTLKAEYDVKIANGEDAKYEPILPIIGCEFFVCTDHTDKTTKDNGSQIVFLAKNKNGYQNLVKLASYAFTQGMYYVPRIDKNLIAEFHEDLIVLSGGLNGEISNAILSLGELQAEESLLWWKELFGDDFYLELMRHGQQNEDIVNKQLIAFSKKHHVKLVACNNTFYLHKDEAESHDVLLCIKENEQVSTPKGRGRGYRFGLENEEYYFKSQEEMKSLFLDVPEAIENITEIIEKCEYYSLSRDVLLPAFDIPEEFRDAQDEIDGGKRGENNYLRHLTYVGAEKRYGIITDEIRERIDFELNTITNTGYPGYFLIVQDFCHAAREMGVSVGPGRGSAAGSAVAYCTGITNVDPIKYDLLFERFLNPERVSMPDIDIDFDDEGRSKVIDYVIQKYGANQVAQIITYGTMAAKSSIRDAARVLDLPLQEADRIAKMIPNNISLNKIIANRNSEQELESLLKNQSVDIQNAKNLIDISNDQSLSSQVVNEAVKIEGLLRNTGIHACGVIITPDDITNYVPVALAKDSSMYCTQYDNSVAESAGLLKMDFLGLKTLTLIKDACRIVKERHGIDLDPDQFDIEDTKTYELFQRGETTGIFQYESQGMQKYMRDLKPTVFADLIAMNALYRPGPIEYIPSFIRRKNGEEEIVYDVADCEENLKETYGITVYQEQVMLLSQKLANFSKGEADTLRKAMGKKQKDVLDKMKPLFIQNGGKNGHPEDKLEKIWKDWEAFASYAFNKSHSTCYAWVAYQTAFLKANYPAEYMASILSNNMNDLKTVTFFMEECKRMGISVLGPDVNESSYSFTVNQKGEIRFGLGAIKGIGSNPVDEIIRNRIEGGAFTSIFDFAKRVNQRVCSKKVYESLAKAGGFDCFTSLNREHYFVEDTKGKMFMEHIMKYGASFQGNENTMFGEDLFGESTDALTPAIPKAEPWTNLYKLRLEKEVIGIYLTGHPLDDYLLEVEKIANGNVSNLKNLELFKNHRLKIAGMVTEIEHRTDKNGNPYGCVTLEDYSDSYRIYLFKEDYLKFKQFMVFGLFVMLTGVVREQKFRNNELKYEIENIEFLSDLRAKYFKKLTIEVESDTVDQLFIESLNEILACHEGDLDFGLNLVFSEKNIQLNMNSNKLKVNPSNELLKELENREIKYQLENK